MSLNLLIGMKITAHQLQKLLNAPRKNKLKGDLGKNKS